MAAYRRVDDLRSPAGWLPAPLQLRAQRPVSSMGKPLPLPFTLWFLSSSSSIFFSLPNLSGRRLDVYHTSTHQVWLSINLECMSEMCCTRLAENTERKNDAKNRHLRTIAELCRAISSQLRHVSQSEKKLFNSNMSPCPRNMASFGRLTAEISWRVWGTLTNFNWFRVLHSFFCF